MIVHQGALGDFIISLPAFEALHRASPKARFTFLAHPHIVEIIKARPYVRDVLNCNLSAWAAIYETDGKLDSVQRELLLPADSIMVFGRRGSQILADNLASCLGKPTHRIDPFPEPNLDLGAAEYQCRQLKELGISAFPLPAAVIAPLEQDIHGAREFVHQTLAPEDKLVLLHPGSGSPKKLWSPAGWLSLIHKMATQGKTRLALVQGPADSHIVQNLRSHLKIESHIHLDNWPLGRLAALMGHADLYIGNDSGITHLAAACGTITIALFGPTDPSIWAPKGSRVEIIHWRSNRSGYGFPVTVENTSEPPPETELVWEKARRFLGL